MSSQVLALVVSIGLADAVNPGTVAPALYLSTTPHPRSKVAGFAAGVFVVNMVGGSLIALGPGQLLLAVVPKPGHPFEHIMELVAAGVLAATAILLLRYRERLRRRPDARAAPGRTGTGFALGAGIAAIELPTALPYFAAIAAVVGSNASVPEALVLLALFNVAFLLPVLAVVAVLAVAGERATRFLARASGALDRHWPTLLAGLLLIVAAAALALGIGGLA